MGAFVPASPEQIGHIERFRCDTDMLPAGRAIIPEHQSGKWLYTLYAGWAFRFRTLSDGRRQILNFLLPGDFVGLQEEFVDEDSCGVEALTDVSLCVFPRDDLWPLFRDHPKLGYDITWLASREEVWVDQHLVTAGRRNADERVAMLLIHLFRRAERVALVADDGSMVFPLNQQHIADILGLSLVHTNRTLRRLQQMGFHRLEGGRLYLDDAHALERVADYAERPMRAVPLI